jgi:hypothetical protein
VLRDDETLAGIDQSLFGDEHILGGPLAGQRLVAHAGERALGRIVLALGRFDLRLRGLQLTPKLNDVGARLVADVVDVQPLLAKRLFVETDRGISAPP